MRTRPNTEGNCQLASVVGAVADASMKSQLTTAEFALDSRSDDCPELWFTSIHVGPPIDEVVV
jgi:hypothetical protein